MRFPTPRFRLCVLNALIVLALTGCEMPQAKYVELLTRADSMMRSRQNSLESQFQLGHWPRFDYDEGTGVLIFSEHDSARVIADVEFVGEVDRHDSTWTWAYDIPAISPFASGALRARRYGWLHGIAELRHSGWHADDVDGWEMTSLTNWITDAEGAYRAPSSDSMKYTFMLLKHVRRAPLGRSVRSYLRSPRAGS
jgi:uncharacterized protein DUF6882